MKKRTELDGHICVTAECHQEANQIKKFSKDTEDM